MECDVPVARGVSRVMASAVETVCKRHLPLPALPLVALSRCFTFATNLDPPKPKH